MSTFFNKSVEGLQEVEDRVNSLDDSLKNSITTVEKYVESFDFKKSKDIEDIETATNQLILAEKEKIKIDTLKIKLANERLKLDSLQEKELQKLIKLEEKENKVKKKQAKLTDEEIKDKIKLQKSNKERKKLLESQLILEKKELKSKKDLNEANKALRIVVDSLDFIQDAEQIKELNEQIDKNTELIQENSDTRLQQIQTVGAYKDSINEAISETGAFDSILGKMDDTTSQLVGGLQKVIVGLKSQKEATEEVGDATDKTGKRVKRFGQALKASGIAVLIAGLTALVGTFTKSRKGALELEIAMAKLNNLVIIVGNVLIKTVKSLGEIFTEAFDGMKKTIFQFQLGWLELKDTFNIGEDVTKSIAKLKKDIESLGNVNFVNTLKGIGAILAIVPVTINEIRKASKGASNGLSESTDLIEKLLRLESQAIDLVTRRSVEVAKLSKKQEELNVLANDDTRALRFMADKSAEVLIIQTNKLKIEKALAKVQQDVAVKRIKLELQQSLLGETNIETIERINGLLKNKSDEEFKSLSFLKDRNIALDVSTMSIEALKEATLGLIEVETEQSVKLLENKELQRKINRDIFEQDLDFAIDLFDRVKSINEKIIASDKTQFRDKVKLLERTKQLNEESFDTQLLLLEENRAKNLAIELDISEAKAKTLLKDLDIRALAEEDDQRKVVAALKFAELNEIQTNRTLEILKERRQFQFDISETEIALNDEIRESELSLLELQKEIAEEKASINFDSSKDELKNDKELTQAKIDNAIKYLNVLKVSQLEQQKLNEELANDVATNEAEKEKVRLEGIRKREEIERNYLEDLEDINQRQVDLEKIKADKIKKINKDLYDTLFDALSQLFSKIEDDSSKRIDLAENRLEQQQKREEDQIKRSEEGLENTRKFEADQSGIKEKAIIEEQKRLETIREVETFFNILNANLNSLQDGEDSSKALSKTLRDVAIAKAIEVSFFGGSDHVAKDLGVHKDRNTGRDDYAIRVDGREKIFKPEHSERVGLNTTNEEIVSVFEAFKRGDFEKQNFVQMQVVSKENRIMEIAQAQQMPFNNMDVMTRADSSLIIEAINNNKSQSVDVREFAKGILTVVETVKKGKTTYYNTHKIRR